MSFRTGIQLAYPFSESRFARWPMPCAVQPKLNGERARLIKTNGRVLLLSSSEEIITSMFHINEEALSYLKDGEYDGELYKHGMPHNEIHSRVSRTENPHPDASSIQYHIFDYIDPHMPQVDRIRFLNTWVGMADNIDPEDSIQRVPTYAVTSKERLYEYYEKFIRLGYEGFIVRDLNSFYERKRSLHMMKFKPKAKDYYKITKVIEAISESGSGLDMVGAFECVDPEGTPFKVGAGKLTHSQRRDIWLIRHQTLNKWLEVEYQTMSDKNKVPLFSRAVQILDHNPEVQK